MKERKIKDAAAVSKEIFVAEFKKTPDGVHWMDHESRRHLLPKEFNRMLRPGFKPWKSLTDDNILQAVASWNWVHEYFRTHRGRNDDVGIGGSKMSKLMLPLMIARHKSADVVYASMGNYLFAAIVLVL